MNSKNDTPEINETSFNLIIVIDKVICKNVKWYHKLLNFISFRYLCVPYYVHEVKKLETDE